MASPQAIANGIKTNAQARAVLGLVANMLRRGYELVPTVAAPFTELFSGSVEELRAQANSSLDIVNAYTQGIYAFIPDNDNALDEQYRRRIQLAIKQAQDTCESISDAAAAMAVDYTDEMASVVLPVLERIGEKIKDLPKTLSTGILASIWPLLLLAGIVLFFYWRGRKALPA